MMIKQLVQKMQKTYQTSKNGYFGTNRKKAGEEERGKNPQSPQKTAKNTEITQETKNKREVTAVQPVESGRSMVEMLGVLAVIGILSVAGIAGYRYAMNKYRANQIASELNLANAQIAFALTRPHSEDYDLTLGSPYDEGTLSSGYAYTYGCGVDTDMEGCLVDETEYYQTLDGLPEDLCKSVAQPTQNLPYLTEQKVNDTVDTTGASCSGESNKLVLLFEASIASDNSLAGGAGNGSNDSDTSNNDSPNGGLSPEDWPFIPVSSYGCSTNDDCKKISDDFIFCYYSYCVKCLTDADCESGTYCWRGECGSQKTACTSNSDCPEDGYCDLMNGSCYTSRSCADDSDCYGSLVCIDGYCKTDDCRNNKDCPEDRPYCHSDGVCSFVECYNTFDCKFSGMNGECLNNKCYEACQSNSECEERNPSSPYCRIDGSCYTDECYTNTDCSVMNKGTVCSGYKCYEKGCQSDAECKARNPLYPYCHVDGNCSFTSLCFSNEDCVFRKEGTVCSGNKCYEEECQSNDDCPFAGQSSSYQYCHTDGVCYFTECSSNEDCVFQNKGTVCSGNKCYKKECQSNADCPFAGQSSSYQYCWADGGCHSYACSSNTDCIAMNNGAICLRNECYNACQTDADCPFPGDPSRYSYCRSDGSCDSVECREDIDCQMVNKGTKCVASSCQ